MATRANILASVSAHLHVKHTDTVGEGHEDLSSWVLIDIIKNRKGEEEAHFNKVSTADDTSCQIKSTDTRPQPNLDCNPYPKSSSNHIHTYQRDIVKSDIDSEISTPQNSVWDCDDSPSYSACTTPESMPSPKIPGRWPCSESEEEIAHQPRSNVRTRRTCVLKVHTHREWNEDCPYVASKFHEHTDDYWPFQSYCASPSQPKSSCSALKDWKNGSRLPASSVGTNGLCIDSKPTDEPELTVKPEPAINTKLSTDTDAYNDGNNNPPSPFPIPPPDVQKSADYKYLIERSLINRGMYEPEAFFTLEEEMILQKLGYEVECSGGLRQIDREEGNETKLSRLNNVQGLEKPLQQDIGDNECREELARAPRCHGHCPYYKMLVQTQRFERRKAARRARMMKKKECSMRCDEMEPHSIVGRQAWLPALTNLQVIPPINQSQGSMVGDLVSHCAPSVDLSSPAPQNDVVSVPAVSPSLFFDAKAAVEEACAAFSDMRQAWANLVAQTAREVPIIAAQLKCALQSGQLSCADAARAETAVEILQDIPKKSDRLYPNMAPSTSAHRSGHGCEDRISEQPSSSFPKLAAYPEIGPAVAATCSSPSQDALFLTMLYDQQPNMTFTNAQVSDIRGFWQTTLEQRAEAVNKAARDTRAKETVAAGASLNNAITAAGVDTNPEWILLGQFGKDRALIQMDWFLENLGVVMHDLGANGLGVRDDGILDVKEETGKARGIEVAFHPDISRDIDWNRPDLDKATRDWAEDE